MIPNILVIVSDLKSFKKELEESVYLIFPNIVLFMTSQPIWPDAGLQKNASNMHSLYDEKRILTL